MAAAGHCWHPASNITPKRVQFPTVPMHSVPSFRLYYVAAFLLGALIALLVTAPARGAESGVVPTREQAVDPAPQSPGAYS